MITSPIYWTSRSKFSSWHRPIHISRKRNLTMGKKSHLNWRSAGDARMEAETLCYTRPYPNYTRPQSSSSTIGWTTKTPTGFNTKHQSNLTNHETGPDTFGPSTWSRGPAKHWLLPARTPSGTRTPAQLKLVRLLHLQQRAIQWQKTCGPSSDSTDRTSPNPDLANVEHGMVSLGETVASGLEDICSFF